MQIYEVMNFNGLCAHTQKTSVSRMQKQFRTNQTLSRAFLEPDLKG